MICLAATHVTLEETRIRMAEEGTTSDFPQSRGQLTQDLTRTRSPDFTATTGPSAGSAQLSAPAPSPASSRAPGGSRPKRRCTGRAPQRLGTHRKQRTCRSGGTGSPDTSNHVAPLAQTCRLSPRPHSQVQGDALSYRHGAPCRSEAACPSITQCPYVHTSPVPAQG